MKTQKALSVIVAATLLLVLAYLAKVEASQDNNEQLYYVTNLPSLGGTASAGNSINNQSWVSGFSNLSGDATTHATLWLNGIAFDLETLGGPNSNIVFPVKNTKGVLAGIAETADADPFGENWSCSNFFPSITHNICLGFVWQSGVMTPLPTLGGSNGFASSVNNRGQVVGWAENTIHDSSCVAPQVLQFHAVIWGPQPNQLQDLPPLPGDSTSAATAINDKGQVAGISGICDRAVGRFSARHAVLWENGNVTDLGNIGGVAWNTPMAMNANGDIAGFANTATGTPGGFHAHAFLWTKSDGIQDLGALPGDVISQGLGINKQRQIVGISCTAGFASCRAFLWEKGVMKDLNDLVTTDYADHLFFANDINDLGVITGQTISGSDSLAFVAVQNPGYDAQGAATLSGRKIKPEVILPENVKRMLLQRLGLKGIERNR